MKKFRYESIFMYSSLQSVGHVEDYFVAHTEKLIVYIVMPRLGNKYNFVRVYRNGSLISEKKILSSSNLLLYYALWYLYYIYFILKYFSYNERFYVFSGHPISFFGMSLQKLVRKITFAYWIGDYFPGNSFAIRAFEKIKKYYHDRVSYRFYLSNSINKVMNGSVIENDSKRTVMWGVKPKNIKHKKPTNSCVLLFVGLIKDSQGIDKVFQFLSTHPNYSIKIIGICDKKLYSRYISLINKLKIEKQVLFPNRFYTDDELTAVSKNCHIGISLYNISPSNPTYYTDPGKIKTYTELGLPVLMSDTSQIVSYIDKFKSGIIVDNTFDSIASGLNKIIQKYETYQKGIKVFNSHFNYEKYYEQKFKFFENR